MNVTRGVVGLRCAFLSMLVSGGAMAQALSGSSLTVNSPQVTYGEGTSATANGSVNGPSSQGTSDARLNVGYSWYAAGGQAAVTGSVVMDFLASYYANSEALATAGYFVTQLNNPIPAGLEHNGPYYLGGVRATLNGTLAQSTLNGAAAAVIARDNINSPITYAAHFTGKSYFSDGVHVASGASTGGFAGRFNGNLLASSYFTFSDARLKKDIRPLPHALERLMQLQPKTYTYAGAASGLTLRKGEEMGLLAQEVESVFPQLVTQTSLKDPSGKSLGEYKAVDYASLIPVLIKGMQEQQELIQSQQARLLQLEAAVQRLSASGQR